MSAAADVTVIGGGIVGLSTAMAILTRHPDVRLSVVEKEPAIARHQTGHNSGVIHSGAYYRPGSLKARLTVAGARRMIDFCRQHAIAHDVCGKVIVATHAEELPRLDELHRRSVANGLAEVGLIGPERLREIEPHAAGLRALHVPATGIVDYAAVARGYADVIVRAGGEILTDTRVLGIVRDGSGWQLETTRGALASHALVNCAGLHSDRVARMAGLNPGVRIVPFRGDYYRLKAARADLVRALIYPVPDPAFPFLGVHFTRMISGAVEAGPNAVLSLDREGYRRTAFAPRDAWEALAYPGFLRLAARHWRTGFGELYRAFNKRAFARALARLLPEIRPDDLEPAGAGVRAQALNASGALLDDFIIEERPRAIHVLNAPSPAATASLMIGEAIAERASTCFGL